MLVLDANILIRAVLGRRVRQLLETYTSRGVRFYAPDDAYADAVTYLPPLLAKRGISDEDLAATIQDLQSLVEPVNRDAYEHFEAEARERLRGRDEEDWPILAAALSLSCPIWTDDADFFGAYRMFSCPASVDSEHVAVAYLSSESVWPSSRQCDFTIRCKVCSENIPAPVLTMADT